jgi:hypothetical protein
MVMKYIHFVLLYISFEIVEKVEKVEKQNKQTNKSIIQNSYSIINIFNYYLMKLLLFFCFV